MFDLQADELAVGPSTDELGRHGFPSDPCQVGGTNGPNLSLQATRGRYCAKASEELPMAKIRVYRLQIIITADELRAVDDFRFKYHLPSRSAAVRRALKQGLTAPVQPAQSTKRPSRRRVQ
jgi:hypothetical protein